MGALVDFHARNKLLMMYYSQKELKAMGRLVANHEGLEVGEVMERYRTHLRAAMVRPPRCGSGVNVLLHAFGYVSSDLNPEEKAEFLDALQEVPGGEAPHHRGGGHDPHLDCTVRSRYTCASRPSCNHIPTSSSMSCPTTPASVETYGPPSDHDLRSRGSKNDICSGMVPPTVRPRPPCAP